MRPRGEIRRALGDAAWQVAREHAEGCTWRELAQRACVGFDVARRTVENMARAGELMVSGTVAASGRGRPANRYVPAHSQARSTGPELNAVMRSWIALR
ncbi:hypothetical protein [Methylibium sp.]|uniref:hypothetical protein n=1 Tax=Methylibium sp. TaxID=2067992 RepID=UPI003D0BAC5C